MSNFQRDGSISNTHVGRAFELRAQKILADHGLSLELNHRVPCGLRKLNKDHAFDLGSETPKVIVECKSQTWTAGGNVPSAKMKNWAEAMFYFHMAPPDYRKIFFVEKSLRPGYEESLLDYFRRTQAHMIPSDVEFWELEAESDKIRIFKEQNMRVHDQRERPDEASRLQQRLGDEVTGFARAHAADSPETPRDGKPPKAADFS